MNNIEKSGALYSDEIDGEHYLLSLLATAKERELINEKEFRKITDAINCETARVIVRSDHGKSSSIRSEVAMTIAESVAFTISMALKKEATPEIALKRLLSDNMLNIFLDGEKAIVTKLNYIKHIYSLLWKQIVVINNETYCRFLPSIEVFLKKYNYNYTAHFTHTTADYPVAVTIENLAGVEFIAKYVEAFYYENKFLAYFNKDRANKLLKEKKYSETTVFNAFNAVFCISIIRLISKMPLIGAPLSASDKSDVISALNNDPSLFTKAKDELYSIIKIKEDGAKEYANFCFDNIILPSLKNNGAKAFITSVFG